VGTASGSASKKKLSYLEAREYATIEEKIAQAEELVRKKQAALENPGLASDAGGLVRVGSELEGALKELDRLYARWHELEEKQG
jgi:ATP-binding cassette subfamily F protein uup